MKLGCFEEATLLHCKGRHATRIDPAQGQTLNVAYDYEQEKGAWHSVQCATLKAEVDTDGNHAQPP